MEVGFETSNASDHAHCALYFLLEVHNVSFLLPRDYLAIMDSNPLEL